MNKNSHLTIGIISGLIFLIIYNISAFAYQCNEIRSDTIRLHVIADSDTQIDQDVKLKVRDAVLNAGKSIFDGTVTKENAQEKITNELEIIENTANETLRKYNMNYTAKAELVTEYFDTRIYDNKVVLPAGKYLALKIVLGEGNGQNWWCVMFPTLCLPVAEKTDSEAIKSVYSDNAENIVTNPKKYEYRFKIVELIEKMKNYVDI